MPVHLRPSEAPWFAEYQAIQAFGWTHDQYMDTPNEARDWLLRIHQVTEKYKAEQQEKANRAG